jgi:lipopolysaccharide biosynthesis protein
MENEHKNICVILHLYYIDLWGYFLPYLKVIDSEIDLYVTITDNHSGNFTDIHDAILKDFPNAYIYSLPNKGMDVAPFLYVMNEIVENQRNYTVMIKLHSKKSLAHSFELGERWRNDLTNALLSSIQQLRTCYEQIVGTNNKMVASKNWVLNQRLMGFEHHYFKEPIIFEDYNFVGGTMFIVEFNLIKDWFIENEIFKKCYPNFEEGYIGDGSIAHQLERVFGCLVKIKGNEILKITH